MESSLYWSALFGFFGICFGSFVHAWVTRVRRGISIAHGRSECPQCHTPIFWYDNIPVISFLLLKGRCRSCKKSISFSYVLHEFGLGLVFFLVTLVRLNEGYGFTDLRLWFDLGIVVALSFTFWYDALYTEILDLPTTYLALPVAFINIIFFDIAWSSILLGALMGAGWFYLQYVVSRGRWVGGGDIRLGLLMGALLGFPGIILALFVAYVLGAIISVALLSVKKLKFGAETPFGTYLAIGTLFTLLWGPPVISWYKSLLFG